MSSHTIRWRRKILRNAVALMIIASVAIAAFTSGNWIVGTVASVVFVWWAASRIVLARSTAPTRSVDAAIIETPKPRALWILELVGWSVQAALILAFDALLLVALGFYGPSSVPMTIVSTLVGAVFTANVILDGYCVVKLRADYAPKKRLARAA